MISCVKCGGTRISGPIYRRAEGYRKERLEHRCLTCGYVWDTPCMDTKR